jgi:hypothetical protein
VEEAHDDAPAVGFQGVADRRSRASTMRAKPVPALPPATTRRRGSA